MKALLVKEKKRIYRHKRIRKKVIGTTQKPRVCVHRSLTNFYVQVIDDQTGKVLFGLSTLAKEVKSKIKYGGNREAAGILGEIFAKKAIDNGIKQVCFDRGGYLYHGRVQSFVESARKGGMEF